MEWSQPIDLYCERTDTTFWAEPINAITNVAFLIAAGAAYVEWRRRADDWPVLALVVVTVLVGIGSFIFHTVATAGAALFDVIPIALFIYGYLFLALRRFFQLTPMASIAIVAAFAALSHGLATLLPPDSLNGSHAYLPALAATLVIGCLLRSRPAGRAIMAAAGVLAVSLTFRTIDLVVCQAFPLGTHFAWHTLNGLVLYLLLRAAMVERGQVA